MHVCTHGIAGVCVRDTVKVHTWLCTVHVRTVENCISGKRFCQC